MTPPHRLVFSNTTNCSVMHALYLYLDTSHSESEPRSNIKFSIVLLAVEDNIDEIFQADVVMTAGVSQNSSFSLGSLTARHRIWSPLERNKNTV